MSERIAIVIPIYNAREMTEKCIASVIAHARGEWRLILVNDCSTDLALGEHLREVARREPARVQLFENEINLGFVGTANRGMQAAQGEDVLLLNSDTEVFEGFLERFRAAASAEPRTGILTPFSNNATLCSIPIPFQENPIPEGFTPAEMNALVAACSLHERPELVTAVGFAMYIKAAVFADTGYFNGEVYGRGFGEENDFCEIAKKAGWKIRLCDDVFVWHKGKASFGDEGRALERKNIGIIEQRHPGYNGAVHRFIAEAPLRELHRRIHLAIDRARSPVADESAMLFLLHKSPFVAMPGGTEFHVLDLVRSLALPRAVIGYAEAGALVAAEVEQGDVAGARFFRFPLIAMPGQFSLAHEEAERILKRWLSLFRIRAAHLHHVMFWPIAVGRVLREAKVPYVYTGHDYLAVCQNWNLFDQRKRELCPCDSSAACGESCLPAFYSRADVDPKSRPKLPLLEARQLHREAFAELFAGAHGLVFPSEIARDLTLARQPAPLEKTAIIEHGYDNSDAAPIRRRDGGGLRAVVIGEIGSAAKGLENYAEMLERTRSLPIEWHFIGASARALEGRLPAPGALEKVRFHGRVDRGEIPEKLAEISADLAVLLPAWHETFSYTVSEAMIAGLPLVVNELGAPAGRVRRSGTGVVCASNAEAASALQRLTADASLLRDLREKARAHRHPGTLDNAEQHARLYQRLGLFEGMDKPARLSAFDLSMLARAAVTVEERRPVPAEVEAPAGHDPTAPKYQSSKLYAPFRLVKPLIPGAVRRLGRDIFRRYQHQTWQVLSPSRGAQVRDLEPLGKFLGEAHYRVRSRDPQIVFSEQSLATPTIRLLRFRLRHELTCESHAQLYWTHERGEPFSEKKSIFVQLSSAPGIWQEYVVRLDSPAVAEAWREGKMVRSIRFDPINLPGVISIAALEFGG